jgi:signal transduction histidine kinase
MPSDLPVGHSLAPRSPRFSLRLKLTLWFVIIFLVVQLSLAFVYELYQRRSINNFFNGRHEIRFHELSRRLRPYLAAGINDDRALAIAQEERKQLAVPVFTLQVLDSQGKLLATSDRPPVLPTSAQLVQMMRADQPTVVDLPAEVLHNPDVKYARTMAGPVAGPDGKVYYMLASRDDTGPQEMLSLVSTVILVTIPIGVIAVFLTAYIISGIAVRPLHDIREVARQLDPGSLGTPVQMHPSGSEAAELQAELERARQRIEAAFASQERFMSNVSHELKTPIAVLLAEAQTIRPSEAPKEIRAFLLSASDELEKLSRTVDSFLLLTRVRQGKGALQDTDLCMVRDIMMDSYEGCASMASQHGVRIDLHLPQGDIVDAAVVGNPDLLRTVLDNLIRNALRFSPQGDVVDVRAWVEGDRLLTSVRDHGPGIPSELLPRVFDRFAQAKEEERRGRGHGLGLEIALGITELHGGTISVNNIQPSEGGGCEFVVSLPVAPTSIAPKAAVSASDA